jgi:hypothetical protein
MVYSGAEHVFILEHYFASKSFLAVYAVVSSAYYDNDVLNKTTVHKQVTKFQHVGSVYL